MPEISLNNKIAIVTGGAQGFGAGIAEVAVRLKHECCYCRS